MQYEGAPAESRSNETRQLYGIQPKDNINGQTTSSSSGVEGISDNNTSGQTTTTSNTRKRKTTAPMHEGVTAPITTNPQLSKLKQRRADNIIRNEEFLALLNLPSLFTAVGAFNQARRGRLLLIPGRTVQLLEMPHKQLVQRSLKHFPKKKLKSVWMMSI